MGRNIGLNAMAGYALTKSFPAKRAVLLLFLSCMLIPFQATIIPAYLITSKLGLLNSYFGLALPLLSTIVCIFVFKAAFEAVPQPPGRCSAHRRPERVAHHSAHIAAVVEGRDRYQRGARLHLVMEQHFCGRSSSPATQPCRRCR